MIKKTLNYELLRSTCVIRLLIYMAQWSVTNLLGRQQNSSHRENVDSYFSHWSLSAAAVPIQEEFI